MRPGLARKLVDLLEQLLLELRDRVRGVGVVRARMRGLALQDRECAQKLGRAETARTAHAAADPAAREIACDATAVAVREQIAHGVVELRLKLGGRGIVITLRCHRARHALHSWHTADACGRRHRPAALREHVADLRQNARANQLDVDLFVQRIETGHHVAVEQLVDDELDLDVDLELFDRGPERLAEHCGADRLFASSTLPPPMMTPSRWLIW